MNRLVNLLPKKDFGFNIGLQTKTKFETWTILLIIGPIYIYDLTHIIGWEALNTLGTFYMVHATKSPTL